MVLTEEQAASLEKTGRCAMDSLRDMVMAMDVDYERLEELKGAEDLDEEERAELEELELLAEGCESEEEALDRIYEDPLEISFRSGWESAREGLAAEEFAILLTTGGPAVRIRGELWNEGREVCRCWLEVQDWGTPWTQHFVDSDDAGILLRYCQRLIGG